MAYNSGYNPDALPAQFPQPSYQNKPPPPVPQSLHQIQPLNYRRPSTSSNVGSPYNSNDAAAYSPPQNHNHITPQQLRPLRSPPLSRSPLAQGKADGALFPLFKAVDRRGTGQLTEEELRAALVNGDFTQFDPHTVKMMIRMFDVNRSGTIGFDEFCALWGFLAAWRTLFERFDEDGSGYICFDEYSKALVAFGYHLTVPFVSLLYRTYDKRGNNQMSFDIFVQSCISLKRMTDIFKKYDSDRDGYVTLSFEEFLTGQRSCCSHESAAEAFWRSPDCFSLLLSVGVGINDLSRFVDDDLVRRDQLDPKFSLSANKSKKGTAKTRVSVYCYQLGPSKYFYSSLYQIPDTTANCRRLSQEEALDKAFGARKEAEIGIASFYYTLQTEERESKRPRFAGRPSKGPITIIAKIHSIPPDRSSLSSLP
ncbi:MAG: hypothetical protein Q9187_005170 [Circinaria calcarea]